MRTLAVASLQSGAGKTRFCLNLAYQLVCAGKRVCLFDADTAFNGLESLLGLQDKLTLENVLLDESPLHGAVHTLMPGLDVLLGGSGISLFALMPAKRQKRFVEQWRQLQGYDFLIFDNPPGLTPQTVSLCLSCRELVLTVSPKSLSITDCCAFLGVLKENGASLPPLLVLNKCRSRRQEAQILELHESTWLYLGLSLLPLGTVAWDAGFADEASRRQPLAALAPESQAARDLESVADRLLNRLQQDMYLESNDVFWKKLFVQLKHRLLPVGVESFRARSQPKPSPPAPLPEAHTDRAERNNKLLLTVPEQTGHERREVTRGNGHLPMPAQSETDGSSPDMHVGIFAPDRAMRELLGEILLQQNDPGLVPHDLLTEEIRPETLSCWIVCLERQDERLPSLAGLMADKPAILLSPLRGREFPHLKNIRTRLPKPFNIADLIDAVERVIRGGGGPEHPDRTSTEQGGMEKCSARA